MRGVITGLKVKDLFRVKKIRKLDFSPNLYFGEGVASNDFEKLRKKLLTTPLLTNVFLLTLPENDSDQIDLISSRLLVQGYFGEHPIKIVGIAGDREDAVSLVLKITEDCVALRKDCMLKEFLKW